MRNEKFAYSFMVVGVCLDQLSTRVTMTHPLIFETNENVLMMMGNGIWLISDIALMVGIISVSYLFIRYMVDKIPQKRYGALISPAFVFGFVRLLAAIWNVGVYLKATGMMGV